MNTRDSILTGAAVRQLLGTTPANWNSSPKFKIRRGAYAFRQNAGVFHPASTPVILQTSGVTMSSFGWAVIEGGMSVPASNSNGNVTPSIVSGVAYQDHLLCSGNDVIGTYFQDIVPFLVYPAPRDPFNLVANAAAWDDGQVDAAINVQMGSTAKYQDDVFAVGNGVDVAIVKRWDQLGSQWVQLAQLENKQLVIENVITPAIYPSAIDAGGAASMGLPAKIISGTINMPDTGMIFLAASVEQSFVGTMPTTRIEVLVDGVIKYTTGDMTSVFPSRGVWCAAAPAGYGSHTVAMKWYCNSPGGTLNYGELLAVGTLRV